MRDCFVRIITNKYSLLLIHVSKSRTILAICDIICAHFAFDNRSDFDVTVAKQMHFSECGLQQKVFEFSRFSRALNCLWVFRTCAVGNSGVVEPERAPLLF